jgi:TonB family protein
MSERKRCIRCERGIDAWAKLCPFCNWDQSHPAPVHEVVPAPVAEYRPPEERSLKQKAIYAGAGLMVLILAFVIGMIINRDGAPKNAPVPVTESAGATVSAPRRADTPLVPTNERGGIEQPITSAPTSGAAPGVPSNEWDRSDATAVSSAEYSQLAQRAKAEKKKMDVLVDPRSITGAAYAQAPPVSHPRTAAPSPLGAPQPQRAALSTRPVPQYQPVPPIHGGGTARLDLVIGADGRVTDINVRQSGGNTAALIAAVQRWRFRPATQNGAPVPAPYSVEISFR